MRGTGEIIRVEKTPSTYCIISKNFLNDDGLSYKAKGLMAYLLSKPDTWVTTISDLVKHAVDQEKSVRSGLKELHERGYYKKVPVRDEKGHFVCWQSTVYETSHLEEMQRETKGTQEKDMATTMECETAPFAQNGEMDCPVAGFRQLDHRQLDYRHVENGYTTNNNITKKSGDSKNQSSQSERTGRTDVDIVDEYKEQLYENVWYSVLSKNLAGDIALVDKILAIALDAIVTKSDYIVIGGQKKPHSVVKSTLLKLDYCDIVNVLRKFKEQTEVIRHVKPYILTMLYTEVLEGDAAEENIFQHNSHYGTGLA